MPLTPRDKRLLQITGVVLPLALLLYFFVLRPDGGEELTLPGPPSGPTGTTGATVAPTASPSATPRETLPPVSLAGSRDPFSIPPDMAPAGGSVSPTATATTIPTTVPTTVPTTIPTTPPSSGGGGGGDGEVRPGSSLLIGGHKVKLLEVISQRKLDVKVDGKVYTVEVGATFDDNFELVRIDGRCARFLFGDQAFELCEM